MVKKGSTLTGSGMGKNNILSISYTLFYLGASTCLTWVGTGDEKAPDSLMRDIILIDYKI